MKNAFLILAVLAAFTTSGAWAGEKAEGEQSQTKHKIICYPEVLTEDDKKRGVEPPCAPENFVYVPIAEAQWKATHDTSGVWRDDEIVNPDGVFIQNSRTKIGAAEVTVSSVAGGMCGTPSTCPVKVRIKTPEQPDKFFELGLVKVNQEYFIRRDLKELLVGNEKYPLK